MSTCSEALANWALSLRFDDLPADIVDNTRYRILDMIGLTLAGTGTGFGKSVRKAVRATGDGGPSQLYGTGDAVSATNAAFANGALSQALEYDDTHNESIVHMSSPSVAAALALAETRPTSGRDVIAAVAISNEIACRIGSVSPGQFHKRGFHPTGLFSPFGTTCLAGRLLGLDASQLRNALGISGSYAAGILECWVDGTQSKFLHPGWAAQSGIVAAQLGLAGATGPAAVFEGRFGLFASHLQDTNTPRNLGRITDGLGTVWDSRKASFKPFPAAHVSHPYIDAIIRLKKKHNVDPRRVKRIDVPVAQYIVGIVCEPIAEKHRPQSDSHGRVSLQYTLAEALYFGRLGKDAYQPSALNNPEILRLADATIYRVDPSYPGPERFKGEVTVTLDDGTTYTEIEEYNRGSAENPMKPAEIIGKFEENAATALSPAAIKRLADAVLNIINDHKDAGALVRLTFS
jgi:2-methylcitrate dehydratase PrpD